MSKIVELHSAVKIHFSTAPHFPDNLVNRNLQTAKHKCVFRVVETIIDMYSSKETNSKPQGVAPSSGNSCTLSATAQNASALEFEGVGGSALQWSGQPSAEYDLPCLVFVLVRGKIDDTFPSRKERFRRDMVCPSFFISFFSFWRYPCILLVFSSFTWGHFFPHYSLASRLASCSRKGKKQLYLNSQSLWSAANSVDVSQWFRPNVCFRHTGTEKKPKISGNRYQSRATSWKMNFFCDPKLSPQSRWKRFPTDAARWQA